MALVAHIAELAEKHRLLERKIEAEVARPGSVTLPILRSECNQFPPFLFEFFTRDKA